MWIYIGMFVFPQEVGECKQRKVVVSTLEAGETGYDDYCEEEFLDML